MSPLRTLEVAAFPDPHGAEANPQSFAESRFGSRAISRLLVAFDASANPMLLADDHRRWVAGNAAASDLLGIPREQIPWRRLDDFTPPSERVKLEQQWEAFLSSGAAEGWYQLFVPNRGAIPVEFSATANVLPSRHLLVFIAPDESAPDESFVRPGLAAGKSAWTPVELTRYGDTELSEREREVMKLVACGLQNGDVADRLFLSSETIKSHVHNAMVKLGAHTRAHAVAIGLVAGQISWDG